MQGVKQKVRSQIKRIQLQKPAGEGEGEPEGGEEPAEVGPIANVADLIGDQKIYEWAGIGFGEIETYRIMKSLK